MSKVEQISISSKNFIEGSNTAGKRMVAHVDRRTEGRIRVENEIERLMEGIIVIPEERSTGEEKSPLTSEKTKIVASYPLGWTKIKRF